MRSNEFTAETVVDEQIKDILAVVDNHPKLFESLSNSSLKEIKEFVLQNSPNQVFLDERDIGNFFSPTNLLIFAGIINLAKFNKEVEFVGFNGKQYVFRGKNKLHYFPESNETAEFLRERIILSHVDDTEKLLTSLILKYGDVVRIKDLE